MVTVVIDNPDVAAQIELLANRFTGGDKAEVVALAMKSLAQRDLRTGSLFGVMQGSVTVRDGVDLIEPALDDAMDAETGPPF